MQGQPNQTPAQADAQTDGLILTMLTDPRDQRPWSIEEIGRELDDPIAATDAVARLRASGLVHRTNEALIFPTRAAIQGRRATE